MKIYGIKQVSNSTRVRVTLAKNVVTDQVRFVPLNVLNGECRTRAFKKIKRAATVPCVKLDDGTYLSQVSAITEYNDDTFDRLSLFNRTTKDHTVIYGINRRVKSRFTKGIAVARNHLSMGGITTFTGLAIAHFGKINIPNNLRILFKGRAQTAVRYCITT